MGCAFDVNGVCSAGIMNVFGCPKNCSRYVEKHNVDLDLDISDSDKSLINTCKKIRMFVHTGRVTIDDSEHSASDNKHLEKFLALCGKTYREVILTYLANLQPFQLIKDKSQEYQKSVTCIIDLSYCLVLYIKINFTSTDAIVVSFHENQLQKNVKYCKKSTDLNYAIIRTEAEPGSFIYANVVIPRGLITLKLELLCVVVSHDLVKINMANVNSACIRYANNKISELVQKDMKIFSSMKEVTFTSYGGSKLNDISVLVDKICFGKNDNEERSELIEVLNIQLRELLTLPDSQDYLEALAEKYSIKLGNAVMKPRILLGLESEGE